MTSGSRRTLLGAGNEKRWRPINAEEDRQRRQAARAASIEELLRRGQRLSAQAARLQRAVIDK